MPTFQLGPGQPAIFLGPQRSGKSNLIAYLVEPHPSVVVFDSSHHPDEWARWGPAHGYVVTEDPAAISQQAKVVYQVPMPALLDVTGWNRPGSPGHQWTQALERVLRRGNTVVVFDEAVRQLPAGRPHPLAMQVYTQGAKYGIGPWAGSQFANRLETATIRAATHAFAFKLNPYDLGLLAEKRGVPTDALAQLPPYGFAYHLTNEASWVCCAPVDRVM